MKLCFRVMERETSVFHEPDKLTAVLIGPIRRVLKDQFTQNTDSVIISSPRDDGKSKFSEYQIV